MNMTTRGLNHFVTGRRIPCNGGQHKGPRSASERTPRASRFSGGSERDYLSPPLPLSSPPAPMDS
jgi:hypothetical protein